MKLRFTVNENKSFALSAEALAASLREVGFEFDAAAAYFCSAAL